MENGVIPEVLQFEYCGTVYDLKLNSEKYTNMSSWFCPEVSYYDNTTGLIIDVDADTLGERYMWLRARSLANSLHNESAYEKTSDELVSIAKDYIGPRLAKLNLNDSDYHIIIQEPNAGRPHYALSFVLDIPLLGISPIVSMTMDSLGFIQTVTMRGNILLDSDFVARLPAIDEEALLYEADNRFREAHCDCDLSVSYRVFQREYNGEMYAELQCGIIPSVKKPETHHHDYVNNAFCVFLELNE